MEKWSDPEIFVELWVGAKVPNSIGTKSVLFRAGEAGTRGQVEALAARPGSAPLFGVLVRNDGADPVSLDSCLIAVFNEDSPEHEHEVRITLNGWQLPPANEKTWEFDGSDVFDLMKILERLNPDLDMTIQAIAQLDGGHIVRSENVVNIAIDE
jgi:hypothetical protein